jgi:DNA-binding transcriptional regulator YdaS (Cro superfamily)
MGNNPAMELLKTWLSEEHGRAVRLARHLGVSPSFVAKMATGERPIPVEHGARLEAFTGGALARTKVFPDRWRLIWPELAEAKAVQD